MPQFSPDQVTFQDLPGYGAFDVGHAREHSQFVATLAQQTPAVQIFDFPLLAFLTAGDARRVMLESHMEAHQALRAALGINGVDLTQVNLDDPNSFYEWLGTHASEHATIRQALSIT
jgi:hypothetical protein